MTVGIKPQASLVPQLSTASVLTFEEVAAIPRPGAQGLSMVKFSPDDRYVTYLGSVEAASLTRQLYVYDRETGNTSLVIAPREGSGEEKSFSKEEALRRERARIMSTGVTEYSWAKNACRLLVPMDGALFVQARLERRVRVAALSPRLSPTSLLPGRRRRGLRRQPSSSLRPRRLSRGRLQAGSSHAYTPPDPDMSRTCPAGRDRPAPRREAVRRRRALLLRLGG